MYGLDLDALSTIMEQSQNTSERLLATTELATLKTIKKIPRKRAELAFDATGIVSSFPLCEFLQKFCPLKRTDWWNSNGEGNDESIITPTVKNTKSSGVHFLDARAPSST